MVKWGVLGTANIARGCTIPGMRLSENCELYAIAGRSIKKAESFRKEFDFKKAYGSYEELLADSDVQAVYIPLPNDLHYKWVKEALNAGKHVLCEKPLTLNEKDAKELFEIAKKNGVILMEAYAYLHSPYIESLKEVVKSGMIGDIDYIETAFLTQGYSDDIRIRKENGGGAMYDLGCYCTTMILTLIDSEPEDIKAQAEFNEDNVDIHTSCMIRFKNKARAAFNVGMVLGIDKNARFDNLYVHGSKGYIRSKVEYNKQGEAAYKIYTDEGVSIKRLDIPQNYSLEIEQMNRCIENGEKPHVSSKFSVKNAKLMDMILKEIGY